MTKRKTAAEALEELGRDPEWVARAKERERAKAAVAAEVAESERPLVDEMRNAGLEVASIWDLAELNDYTACIPILLKHVRRPYPAVVREGIFRALAVPAAAPWWDELVQCFEGDDLGLPPELEYLPALVLSNAADESRIEDLLRLVADSRHGVKRAPLLLALERSRDARARMSLNALKSDPDLGNEIKRMRRLNRIIGKRVVR